MNYRLGDLPRPFWVRFNKNTGFRQMPQGYEHLVLGYCVYTDEILVAGAWLGLRTLIEAEAEWGRPLVDGGCHFAWTRIGYAPQRGQLQPKDLDAPPAEPSGPNGPAPHISNMEAHTPDTQDGARFRKLFSASHPMKENLTGEIHIRAIGPAIKEGAFPMDTIETFRRWVDEMP